MSNSATLRLRVWGVVLVNLATLAWATNAVAGRWLRADIGPVTLSALRFTLATVLFGLILQKLPREERRYGKDKWWILGMSLTGVVGFSILYYLGLRYSTAVNGSLIQGFSPLITALLAGLIIHEPVSKREKAGAVLGFIGIVGLISGGSLTFLLQLQFNPGDLFLLASATLWPFYSIFGRRVMRHRSPVATMALSNFLALPVLFIAAAFELHYIPLNLRPETVAAIAHVCIVPTIVGFWCWNKSVQILGAGRAMIFYYTLPLYGVFLGALLLGEPLGMVHLVFGGMIIGGGLWATLGGLKPRK
ncbi:MAG: DMT family transporter [Deltaproteobacteria bacterium]|nr:DMT family transporter [Deltaproteobacteria bacterium]